MERRRKKRKTILLASSGRVRPVRLKDEENSKQKKEREEKTNFAVLPIWDFFSDCFSNKKYVVIQTQ